MRLILIAIIFLFAGCTGNDKKTVIDYEETHVSSDGELLFKNNCASCHKCDKDFTGPALLGALERWGGDKKAMYEFIRNPSRSIVENAYAKKLYEKWNKTMMIPFPFSDAELDALMNYCSNADPPIVQ